MQLNNRILSVRESFAHEIGTKESRGRRTNFSLEDGYVPATEVIPSVFTGP